MSDAKPENAYEKSTDEKEILKELIYLKAQIADKENVLETLKKYRDEMQARLIEIMEADDRTSISYEGIGTVTLGKPKLYASYDKENQDQVIAFCSEEMGRPDVVKRTVHPSTLSTFIGELLEKGEKIPSFIKTYFKPSLYIRENGGKT